MMEKENLSPTWWGGSPPKHSPTVTIWSIDEDVVVMVTFVRVNAKLFKWGCHTLSLKKAHLVFCSSSFCWYSFFTLEDKTKWSIRTWTWKNYWWCSDAKDGTVSRTDGRRKVVDRKQQSRQKVWCTSCVWWRCFSCTSQVRNGYMVPSLPAYPPLVVFSFASASYFLLVLLFGWLYFSIVLILMKILLMHLFLCIWLYWSWSHVFPIPACFSLTLLS